VRRMSTLYGGKGGAIVQFLLGFGAGGFARLYIDYAAIQGPSDTLTSGLAKAVAEEAFALTAVRPWFHVLHRFAAKGGARSECERIKTRAHARVGTEEVASADSMAFCRTNASVRDRASWTRGGDIADRPGANSDFTFPNTAVTCDLSIRLMFLQFLPRRQAVTFAGQFEEYGELRCSNSSTLCNFRRLMASIMNGTSALDERYPPAFASFAKPVTKPASSATSTRSNTWWLISRRTFLSIKYFWNLIPPR